MDKYFVASTNIASTLFMSFFLMLAILYLHKIKSSFGTDISAGINQMNIALYCMIYGIFGLALSVLFISYHTLSLIFFRLLAISSAFSLLFLYLGMSKFSATLFQPYKQDKNVNKIISIISPAFLIFGFFYILDVFLTFLPDIITTIFIIYAFCYYIFFLVLLWDLNNYSKETVYNKTFRMVLFSVIFYWAVGTINFSNMLPHIGELSSLSAIPVNTYVIYLVCFNSISLAVFILYLAIKNLNVALRQFLTNE